MKTADVVIAGAGIIGLSTAIELAAGGLRVVVLERGRAMAEASWAAAGMLAARDPENPSHLRPLAELSIALYPDYLDTMERLSGLHIPLRTHETLQGSAPGHAFANPLSAADLAQRLPGLHPGSRSFCLLREDSLDPRDLCAALPKAAVAAGVQLAEHAPVTAVRYGSSAITISTPHDEWSARHFVNCCGAWAGTISSAPAVEPRKGQMATVMLPPQIRLDEVIRTPELYLVPRGGGRVVIGASVERAGFDKAVHAPTIQSLLAAAAELWPPVRDAVLVESWAGLRPATSDGLPVIGPCGERGFWIASGHFRNGILLAPGTARVMRELIHGRPVPVALEPFRCDRFAAALVS